MSEVTQRNARAFDAGHGADACELSIVIPCLDEAETIGTCVTKAMEFLCSKGVDGEVVVADNGSTDGSRKIARAAGARVVEVADRGYGAAVLGGIEAARGTYVIMGDADDSYDFANLSPFLSHLRAGAEVVMGNRFLGGIEPGAMPLLHRYLGNPGLSFTCRLFFGAKCGDILCGLRGFSRDSIRTLGLQSTGMEFGTEMVVRSVLHDLKIVEVPTRLSQAGRSRAPHLKTWRDGWRNLQFLLMFSPRWLFVYPGIALLALGLLVSVLLLPGPVALADGISLDLHTLAVSCLSVLIGLQCLTFGFLARRYAIFAGFIPVGTKVSSMVGRLSVEWLLVSGAIVFAAGLAGIIWAVFLWSAVEFGPLAYGTVMRIILPSAVAIAAGLQLGLTGFLAGIMEIRRVVRPAINAARSEDPSGVMRQTGSSRERSKSI